MIEEQLREDMEALGAKPVQIQSQFTECFLLVSSLQLALRHPDFPEHAREHMTNFALRLQETLSITPTIAAVLDMGWNAALDVESVQGTKCRVCGCTEEKACPDGCYWVEPDLCSQCAPAARSIIIP